MTVIGTEIVRCLHASGSPGSAGGFSTLGRSAGPAIDKGQLVPTTLPAWAGHENRSASLPFPVLDRSWSRDVRTNAYILRAAMLSSTSAISFSCRACLIRSRAVADLYSGPAVEGAISRRGSLLPVRFGLATAQAHCRTRMGAHQQGHPRARGTFPTEQKVATGSCVFPNHTSSPW